MANGFDSLNTDQLAYCLGKQAAGEYPGPAVPDPKTTTINVSKPEAPMTLNNLTDMYSKATLGAPSRYVPKSWTGPIPSALIHAGLGALAGRYIGAPILSAMYPEMDPDKLRNVATLGGGALMGGIPAYSAYRNYAMKSDTPAERPTVMDARRTAATNSYARSAAQNAAKAPEGNFDEVYPQLYDAYSQFNKSKYTEGINPKDNLIFKQSSEKLAWNPYGVPERQPVGASFFTPQIGIGSMQNSLDAAVYNHTINEADAANVMQLAREASGNQPHGLFSAQSLANAAIGYGVGNVAARGIGALATTLFGFPPQKQLQMAQGAGVAGALYNVLGGLAP